MVSEATSIATWWKERVLDAVRDPDLPVGDQPWWDLPHGTRTITDAGLCLSAETAHEMEDRSNLEGAGSARLVDFTGLDPLRPWWYVDFAARCGVDVCSMAYRDALDQPVPHVQSYRTGVACVYPYPDYFACRELMRTGDLSLGDWVRSWIGAVQPVLRWDDPWPAVRASAGILIVDVAPGRVTVEQRWQVSDDEQLIDLDDYYPFEEEERSGRRDDDNADLPRGQCQLPCLLA